MEPSIHEGDYIYIKRTDTDSLKAGDIISFYSQDDSIKGEINTHRISEVLSDGTFVTKGDANKIEGQLGELARRRLSQSIIISSLYRG